MSKAFVKSTALILLVCFAISLILYGTYVLAEVTISGLLPADNSYSNTSTPTFYFTPITNVSGSINCTLFLNSSNKGSNNSIVNNTNSSIVANITVDGFYVWYVNCTDAQGTNQSASKNITIDTTAPTGSHTSSGYYGNATINGTLEIIFRETLVTLGKNGYLRFPIKNLWHRCTLISVGNGSVTFSVESTPKQVTVKEGEYALVDVTDDGNADVNITVVKIYSSGATVRFSPVEQQPVATTPVTPPIVTPTVPPVTPPAQNASVVKNETTPVPSGRKLPLVWAYVILVAILGIIAFFIYSVMSRKKTEQ